jgi:hypothetical protein
VEHDNVERAVLQRERTRIALDKCEIGEIAPKLTALLDEDRRRIDADYLSHTRYGCQRPSDGPRATADLGDARISRKLDVREIRVAHLTLLRIVRAKLQDLHQSLHHGGLRFADGEVDVRHDSSHSKCCSLDGRRAPERRQARKARPSRSNVP